MSQIDDVHQTARIERELLRAYPGDEFTATVRETVGSRTRLVTYTGIVQEIKPGSPGNSLSDASNHAVILSPEDGPFPDESASDWMITLDYYGAHTSEVDYYYPYVTATSGTEILGDVESLRVNKKYADVEHHTIDECVDDELWLKDENCDQELVENGQVIEVLVECPACGRNYSFVHDLVGLYSEGEMEYVWTK